MLESHTDYYQVLSEAFGPVVPSARADRKKIYNAVRQALKEQAKLVQHRFDLTAELAALEKAILDVEISAKNGETIPRWKPGTKPKRPTEPFVPPSMQRPPMPPLPDPNDPPLVYAPPPPPQPGGPRIEWADPAAIPAEERGTYLPPHPYDPTHPPPPLPPTSPVRRVAGPSFQPAFLQRPDRISYARQADPPPPQPRQPPPQEYVAPQPTHVPLQPQQPGPPPGAAPAMPQQAPSPDAAVPPPNSLNPMPHQSPAERKQAGASFELVTATQPPRGGALRTVAVVLLAACLGGAIAYVVKPEQLIRQLIDEYGGSFKTSQTTKPSSTGASVSIDESKATGDDYVQLAIQQTAKRDYAQALTTLEEAQKLGATGPDFYQARAYANWGSGNLDRAIADYGEAIRLNPGYATNYSNRAVAYNSRGDYVLAIRDLERAIAIDPANPDFWNSRCWARALAGQTQEAILDCNESLRLRPDDANTIDSRGFAYLKAGQNTRAIADFDTVLKIAPNTASSLYGRGVARMRTGDRANGANDIAEAKAIMPTIDQLFAKYGLR